MLCYDVQCKVQRKPQIIYQKITKENFSKDSLPKRVQDVQREVTLNTENGVLFNIVYIFPVFSGCIQIKTRQEINMDYHYNLAKTANWKTFTQ